MLVSAQDWFVRIHGGTHNRMAPTALVVRLPRTIAKRKSAERVAHSCLDEAKDFLAHDAPIEKHLCDQLLLPLALAGGGSFRTTAPTAHSLTNAEVIRAFLPIDIRFEKEPTRAWLVTLATA